MLPARLTSKLLEFSHASAPSLGHNFRHFSFIVRKNKILSIGINQPWKTHPLANKFGHRFSSIHSELSAITNFPGRIKDFSSCKMVNVRINIRDHVRISRPCVFCTKLLNSFNIKEVWYTDNLGSFTQL